MAMKNKGCGCCGGGTTPPTLVNPGGCNCTQVPAGLFASVSPNQLAWTYYPEVPEYTPDQVYKSAALTYYPAGTKPAWVSANGRNYWISDQFDSMYTYNDPNPPFRLKTAYRKSYYTFACSVSAWTISMQDAGQPTVTAAPIWQFTVTNSTTGPNYCNPFMCTCGNPPGQQGPCSTAWNVH